MASQSTVSSARRKRFSILGLTMLLVIIPFFLYYFFFVSSQMAYFSNRNFRVLAAIGEHMSSKIDSLAINLVNLAKKVNKDKTNPPEEKKEKAAKSKTVAEMVTIAAILFPISKRER